jgi:hypothetical protein
VVISPEKTWSHCPQAETLTKNQCQELIQKYLPWFQRFIFIIFIAKGRGKINRLKAAIHSSSRANQFELGRLLHLLFGVLRIFGTLIESNRKRSHDCSDCPYSKAGAARTVM